MQTHCIKRKSHSRGLSDTQLFKHVRGLGDSWSNSIRAAADTK
ncbi:pyruvate kinase [Gardnerella vaginalis]|nr:pyruvate kinase [Gardnerella vaginalis]PKZ53932.1 pyruvate kinase [Gardnerella vaginalis]PKZ56043.1 pyruvate kinase [Gardnerella vaginalis]PKZ58791.1 pyruvate kinase [Gardnerella vaginalis]